MLCSSCGSNFQEDGAPFAAKEWWQGCGRRLSNAGLLYKAVINQQVLTLDSSKKVCNF